MAKKIRFPLIMENGIEVRSIEELRDNFSISKVIFYLREGKLIVWLRDRYANDIADLIEELIRDKKSYGYVYITPNWSDSDKLKNCLVTYYRIDADSEQVSRIKFNNTDLSKLRLKDFKTRKMTDIFSLSPVDYEEVGTDTSYILKIQTHGYSLWKSYRIEVKYNSDSSLDLFGIGAQHTIWE